MNPAASPPRRWHARALWVLLALFALRVLAQLTQVLDSVSWLPPFDAWHGAVLPYPALLAAQLAILALQVRIAHTVTSGRFRASRRAGRAWLGISALYFTGMAIRLGLGLSVLSTQRWFGATLPAFFHIVLASFGLVVGLLHRRRMRDRERSSSLPAGSRFTALALAAYTLTGCQTVIARFALPRDGIRAAGSASKEDYNCYRRHVSAHPTPLRRTALH